MASSIPDPIPADATPEQLRHIINYWKIEAEQANACRWRLEEERERSNRQYQSIIDVQLNAIDQFKDEIWRLRVAGDYLESQFKLLVSEDTHANRMWREAKEGRKSK